MLVPSLWPGFEGIKTFSQNFIFPKLAADFAPRVDIYQNEDEIVLKAELPGMGEQDPLDIRVTPVSVTIRGELKHEQTFKTDQCCHQECYYGTFQRIVALPAEVQAENALAEYKDGLLTVRMPRKKDSDGHSLKINRLPGTRK